MNASNEKLDLVHLVDRHGDARHAEEPRDEQMAPCLLRDAAANVDQDDRDVGVGSRRHHIACVLHVTGRVREDEPPPGRREITPRDVYRDPLLAFRAEPVREEREIGSLKAAALADLRDVLDLIGHERLRVEEQAPEERALPIIDAAGGGTHEGGQSGIVRVDHQKYPSRFRSSIAASVARLSARVAPRSVTRALRTS